MKLPKIRKLWKIKPVSRVRKSAKVYSRQKAKGEEKKIEGEEGIKRNV